MAASVAPAEALVVRVPPGTRFSDLELLDFLRLNPDLRVEHDEEGALIVMAPTGPEIGSGGTRCLIAP